MRLEIQTDIQAWINFRFFSFPVSFFRTVDEMIGMVLSSFRLLINKVTCSISVGSNREELRYGTFSKICFTSAFRSATSSGQHLKKQTIQIVIVFDFIKVEKCIGLIAFVVGNELGFQQLQEQYSVDPSDGEFKTYIEKLFLLGISKLAWAFQPTDFIQTIQLNDGIF